MFGSTTRPSSTRRIDGRRFRADVEGLEARLALSLTRPVSGIQGTRAAAVVIRSVARTGTLEIRGTSGADTVEIGRSARGFVTLTVNGVHSSGDLRDRASFDRRLAGVRADHLRTVRLAGSDPFDTVVLKTALGSARIAAVVQSQAVTIAAPVSQAGTLKIEAESITIAAAVRADAVVLSARGLLNLEAGGSLTASRSIDLKADRLIQTGNIAAPAVSIVASVAMRSGTISSPGGAVQVEFTENYVATRDAAIDVSSSTGSAGTIRIDGGATGHFFSSGLLVARGARSGGKIRASGKDVVWVGGGADASGDVAGGLVQIGGGWQGGDATMSQAGTLRVSAHTRFSADGADSGGTVVLWSTEATTNLGVISARGGHQGGAVEVSSKISLAHGGSVDVGPGGRFLLDPKNIVIGDNAAGGVPMFELANPTPDVNDNFGASIVPLSTGNVVVTDPGDDAVASNAGAVYLYDGATGVLISTLTGSTANDAVGSNGVTVLSNGNFVVRTVDWDRNTISNAGAVTWGSGTAGVSGAVSATNSLVGSTANDQIGIGGVTALTNGNYVVSSYFWDSPTISDAGAATWANGSTGLTGEISSGNSLVGSSLSDQVGILVTALLNGAFVVRSYNWDDGSTSNVGAVTWGSGTGVVSGAITSANSLIGSTANDLVGFGGLTVLSNGNYVVISYSWDNGLSDVGAVTWGDGDTGVSGVVSETNSLIGSKALDQVGFGGVIALSNGNYVVRSTFWDNDTFFDAGAVTWGNGTTGTAGAVSTSNSLVGSSSSDQVGSQGVTALADGDYVVLSPQWDSLTISNAGAATWANGGTGISGTISSSNSLIGSAASDRVGSSGIRELTNGHYVVQSPFWNGSRGAVTWGSGSTGRTGIVSSSNSLVGSTANDGVGSVTALSNGNYVVASQNWDNGATANVGAVTWGNGTTGTTGAVSTSNSLYGSTANDQVGLGITALTNGNYVVSSTNWDRGAIVNAGAVTWLNGSAAHSGIVTASNSLVGGTAADLVGGGGVTALTNGNYVVRSTNWDAGTIADAGAITWADGTTGIAGDVSSANSMVGSRTSDQVGFNGMTLLSSGNYLVRSQLWDNFDSIDAGALTWGSATSGAALTGLVGGPVALANSIVGISTNTPVEDTVNGTFIIRRSSSGGAVYVGLATPLPSGLSFAANAETSARMSPAFVAASLGAGTATTLQANNDITFENALTVDNPSGTGGALSLQAGRSVNLGVNLTTDGGGLTVLANGPASAGVVDAQRDAGAGSVNVPAGVTIDAGGGAVSLSTGAATGLTNRTSGGLTIAGTVLAGSATIATADSGSGTPDIGISGSIEVGGAGGIAVNSAAAVTFGSNGSLRSTASGAGITVTGDSISLSGQFTTNGGPVTYTGPATLTGYLSVSAGSGVLAFANGLEVGSQAATFLTTTAATVAGTLSLDGGVILATTGGISVGSAGSVTGHGMIAGSVTIAGAVAPGSGASGSGGGLLNFGSGSLTLAATSTVSMNGTSRTAFDKVVAAGVSLAGATLSLDLSATSLSAGDSITLVDNVSAAATSGTFAGLAQGAIFTVNGHTMQIDYRGGDGNDVVVTKLGDISTSFSVSRSGFFYVIASNAYRQTITLSNLTSTAKVPRSFEFVGLPAEVSVIGGTKVGSNWYLSIADATVPANGSLGVPVLFVVPSASSFSYSLIVLGG